MLWNRLSSWVPIGHFTSPLFTSVSSFISPSPPCSPVPKWISKCFRRRQVTRVRCRQVISTSTSPTYLSERVTSDLLRQSGSNSSERGRGEGGGDPIGYCDTSRAVCVCDLVLVRDMKWIDRTSFIIVLFLVINDAGHVYILPLYTYIWLCCAAALCGSYLNSYPPDLHSIPNDSEEAKQLYLSLFPQLDWSWW